MGRKRLLSDKERSKIEKEEKVARLLIESSTKPKHYELLKPKADYPNPLSLKDWNSVGKKYSLRAIKDLYSKRDKLGIVIYTSPPSLEKTILQGSEKQRA